MTDVHFMCGHASGSSREAGRLYAEHGIPSHKLFTQIYQRLSNSGSFAPRASVSGRPPSVRSPDVEVGVSRRAEEDPGASARGIAAAEGIGVPHVLRILYEPSRSWPHSYTYFFMAWCITHRDNYFYWCSLLLDHRPRFFMYSLFSDSLVGGSTRAILTRLSSAALTLQDGALLSCLYQCLHVNSLAAGLSRDQGGLRRGGWSSRRLRPTIRHPYASRLSHRLLYNGRYRGL